MLAEKSNPYMTIREVAEYLRIKASTIYSLAEQKRIPHYKIGRLVRFKRSEIDQWMEGNREECVDPGEVARKILGPVQRNAIDIDRIVRKAVEGTRGQGYTESHGKPDQVKGLGREDLHGSL
jgi:excisionase family DNA binding protein